MPLIVKTFKVPQALARRLEQAARRRGCPESELIREGLEKVVSEPEGLDMQALLGPHIGTGSGPRDLSSNRKKMAGYGRSRHR